MGNHSMNHYLELLDELATNETITNYNVSSLMDYLPSIYRSEQQDKFSEPMLWIGMYIALASFVCIVAMVVDLLHGLKNRKLWFPCKYFTINSATITVIGVAMKLPVDLTGSMPGDVDQVAKLGSLAFMCTMMANLLPSLATMDNNELLSNIIALGILVVTLVVNVCIQIQTGVVTYNEKAKIFEGVAPTVNTKGIHKHRNSIIATVYVIMLLVLLIIHICSSLAILKSKKIIESKYQKRHDKPSKEKPQERLTSEKLKEDVRKYWIMAQTGCPQFITTCYATTSAAGVICVATTILHIINVAWNIQSVLKKDYDSDYKLGMLVIFIVQFIGVILGTIAPLARCFAQLSFKVSFKTIWTDIKVFEVEKYWTHELIEWKQSSIPFPFRIRKCKKFLEKLKALILSIYIEFHETVVVACKMVAVIPYLVMICVFDCFRSMNWLKTENPKQNHEDFSGYVLQLHRDMKFADETLDGLSKSYERLIKKGENRQPENLIKLISDPIFEEVEKYDSGHVPNALSNEYLDCWSLPMVTLTTIAVSLPKISKEEVDRFLKGVSEGIEYVKLVEERINASTDAYVHVQKAAKTLWREVEVDKKWLGTRLKDIGTNPKDRASQKESTVGDIVQWFMDKAREMDTVENKSMDVEDQNDHETICANSMYRITKTIMLSHQSGDDDKVRQNELFKKLESMISGILAACLTNLPYVIIMKCHTSAIEKREANVHFAARLLGETKEIMKKLQEHEHEVPHLDANELLYIDNWRDYFRRP